MLLTERFANAMIDLVNLSYLWLNCLLRGILFLLSIFFFEIGSTFFSKKQKSNKIIIENFLRIKFDKFSYIGYFY